MYTFAVYSLDELYEFLVGYGDYTIAIGYLSCMDKLTIIKDAHCNCKQLL